MSVHNIATRESTTHYTIGGAKRKKKNAHTYTSKQTARKEVGQHPTQVLISTPENI